jgi:hypothetical protein
MGLRARECLWGFVVLAAILGKVLHFVQDGGKGRQDPSHSLWIPEEENEDEE